MTAVARLTLVAKLARYGDIAAPEGLGAQALRYLKWMEVVGFSPVSVETRMPPLGVFIRWCDERGVTRPGEVTQVLMERYQRWLAERRRPNGAPLRRVTQKGRLVAVIALFRWLAQQQIVPFNPAGDLEIPRQGRPLPRGVLTYDEMEQVLGQPDVATPRGLRDRAMMEVLYSTGIRRQELMALRLLDLLPDQGTVMVREGKGRKDRMVPIGDRALGWLRRYLEGSRPWFVERPEEPHLFLSDRGQPFCLGSLTHLVSGYVRRALPGKTGACHIFRHTMATLMLENGADIRYIQEMLGHAQIQSTQIYTHVSIRKLKEVHEATHPAQVGLLHPLKSEASEAVRELLAEALGAEEGEEDGKEEN